MIDVEVASLNDSTAEPADVAVQLEHGSTPAIHESTLGVACSMPADLTAGAPWVAALPSLGVPAGAFGLGRVEVAGHG